MWRSQACWQGKGSCKGKAIAGVALAPVLPVVCGLAGGPPIHLEDLLMQRLKAVQTSVVEEISTLRNTWSSFL